MQFNLGILFVFLGLLLNGSFAAAPSKAPTQQPIITPTAAPSRQPTKTPTHVPTAYPTRKPTCIPTTIPTTKPSTLKPTVKPTSAPTLEPSAKPTQDPTVSPTVDPTIEPTEAPTAHPTDFPTFDPTAEPTNKPTRTPTATVPSRNPTIKPTQHPTRTFAPSHAPTNQVSPVVSYYANITVNDITEPFIDEDGKSVVAKSVSDILGFPSTSVTFISTGTPVEHGRRLSDSKYNIPSLLKIHIALSSTQYESAAYLYTNTTNILRNAVENGKFDATLQANAAGLTPDLAGATSYQVVFTAVKVADPPTVGKEELNGLTEGGTAIIVICCLVMAGVVLYMCYEHSRHSADHSHGNAKGYAIADEDDETFNKL